MRKKFIVIIIVIILIGIISGRCIPFFSRIDVDNFIKFRINMNPNKIIENIVESIESLI